MAILTYEPTVIVSQTLSNYGKTFVTGAKPTAAQYKYIYDVIVQHIGGIPDNVLLNSGRLPAAFVTAWSKCQQNFVAGKIVDKTFMQHFAQLLCSIIRPSNVEFQQMMSKFVDGYVPTESDFKEIWDACNMFAGVNFVISSATAYSIPLSYIEVYDAVLHSKFARIDFTSNLTTTQTHQIKLPATLFPIIRIGYDERRAAALNLTIADNRFTLKFTNANGVQTIIQNKNNQGIYSTYYTCIGGPTQCAEAINYTYVKGSFDKATAGILDLVISYNYDLS